MRKFSYLLMIMALFTVVSTAGCAKQLRVAETESIEVTEAPVVSIPLERKTGSAGKEAQLSVGEESLTRDSEASAPIQDVFFDFDRSEIRDAEREILIRTAEWFNAHPDSKLRIEGHCDERGTTAYNLALGHRRAEAAKRFLSALGVDSSRMTTVSYGEEKLFCEDHAESCYQLNRRVHFIVE